MAIFRPSVTTVCSVSKYRFLWPSIVDCLLLPFLSGLRPRLPFLSLGFSSPEPLSTLLTSAWPQIEPLFYGYPQRFTELSWVHSLPAPATNPYSWLSLHSKPFFCFFTPMNVLTTPIAPRGHSCISVFATTVLCMNLSYFAILKIYPWLLRSVARILLVAVRNPLILS